MKKFRLFLIVLLTPLLFLSQQSNSNVFNDFFTDTGSFEILSRYQGKGNVIKINGSKLAYPILQYSLMEYRGKDIAVHFSADFMMEGNATNMLCCVNVNNYERLESIFFQGNITPRTWFNIKVKRFFPADFLATEKKV
ncbi:MAG: hypothetical protein FWC22_01850 [Treponema sp.]|nr:hypothetical protein [Treponema sp.]